MALRELVPAAWRGVLAVELESPRFAALERFVEAEYASQRIYPRREHLFRALALAPPESIKVVILGQDPYHGHGQAHGLCFSVPPLTQFPPSLRNIFKELEADLGQPPPLSGDLEAWARQGVLLLNTVLTVREGAAHSHAGRWRAPAWRSFARFVHRRGARAGTALRGAAHEFVHQVTLGLSVAAQPVHAGVGRGTALQQLYKSRQLLVVAQAQVLAKTTAQVPQA